MALAANGNLTVHLPLSRSQQHQLNIFTLSRRPGILGASYPWSSQQGSDTTRIKVRGTAKALRILAGELGVALPVLIEVETTIAEARQETQIVSHPVLYPQLQALLDDLGRSGPVAAPEPVPNDYFRVGHDDRRLQLVVLRYGRLVVGRFGGRGTAFTYLSETAAADKARELIRDAEDMFADRQLHAALSADLGAHHRSRVSALAV